MVYGLWQMPMKHSGTDVAFCQQARVVLNCQHCDAQVSVSQIYFEQNRFAQRRDAVRCPLCDLPCEPCHIPNRAYETHGDKHSQLFRMLPFQVTRDAAFAHLQQWLRARWFVPHGFLQQRTWLHRCQSMYMPYWLYGCDTKTRYSGERGDDFYIDVTRTNSDGKSVTQPERRTSWRSVSGFVPTRCQDVLVPAAHVISTARLHQLEPWDLRLQVDDQADCLSVDVCVDFQVDMAAGYARAKERMQAEIEHAIRLDIGGDAQRIHHKETQYLDVIEQPLQLPVWVLAYQYQGKLFQVLINGQTGKVQGAHPYCWLKIASCVVASLAALGVMLSWLG